jgi:hypothetical protein
MGRAHSTHGKGKRNEDRFLLGKEKENRPIGIPKCRREEK